MRLKLSFRATDRSGMRPCMIIEVTRMLGGRIQRIAGPREGVCRFEGGAQIFTIFTRH
jgi:hypothetical protein